MLEINQVDYKLDSIKDYDFVLFTSKNGLRYFKGLFAKDLQTINGNLSSAEHLARIATEVADPASTE